MQHSVTCVAELTGLVDSITYFALLSANLSLIAQLLPWLGDVNLSFERITQYIEVSEQNLDPFPQVDPNVPAIEVRQASFKWSEDQERPTLKNIDLSINTGLVQA